MPEWTQGQREAINARSSETLVSAAAGSGKTAVLIEHVLTLLRQGGKVERLLIITFTRAAAAELRERLTAALDREAPGNAHLRAQRLAMRRAQISTLHVFCHSILRRHFQACDVDPMARIGETQALEPLLIRALDESMEEMCQSEDADAQALLRQYGDAQIVDMARQLYNFLRAQADPHGWMEKVLADPAGRGMKPFEDILRRECLMRLEGAIQLSAQCKKLLTLPRAPMHLEATAENDRQVLEMLASEVRAGRLQGGETRFAARARAPKGVDFDPLLAERFSSLRDRMKALAQEARSMLAADPQEERAQVAFTVPALRALARLVWAMDEKYSRYKEAKNLLDYGDLEHKALQALADPQVCESVAAGYDAIFVDEYQDVSAIQEAIVRRVHNANNRLFMVGDVKQSIYRFRLADPTLFLRKYEEFGDENTAKSRRILLSSNFRSRGNVLAAVNSVFERAMRRGATEIDYDERAQLRAGVPTAGDPPVQLHLIAGDAAEEEEAGESRSGWMYEAQLAAKLIASLVGQPVRDKTGERPLRYRDCVILLRSASGRAPQIARILAAEGVPAFSDADGQYFDLPEVRDMLNLLRVLDNPYQDVALLSTLRCPCFSFTSARLAHLRLQDETRQKPFYKLFFARRGIDADVTNVCEKLDEWRFMAHYLGVDELIWEILQRTGLYARAGAQKNGAMRQANLRLLIERARSEATRYSLHDFLLTSDMARRVGDTGAAREMSENDDVVRIMTLHKSKGLEFPVVIMMELARAFRMPSESELLRCDAQTGVALKRVDDEERLTGHTLCGRALGYKRMREIRAEEARLLYVGMTRARERLILLASPRSMEKAREVWELPAGDYAAGCARCMLDWIGQALTEGLDTGCDVLFTARNGSEWEIKYHQKDEFKQTLPAEAPFVMPGKGEEDPRLPARMAHKSYEHHYLKTSVTALLRAQAPIDEGMEETIESKRRALRIEQKPKAVPDYMLDKKPGGAERGTAMHKALCALAPEKEIAPQLDVLCEMGYFSPEERKLLRIGDLERFFDSELGRRARQADGMRREWSFCLMEGDILVQGVIDLCFVENGAWVAVDYKTDRCPAERLPEMYGDQIRWYARALRTLTGREVEELWLYSLHEGRAIRVNET